MELPMALSRVGATIAKEAIADNDLTVYLRVDPKQGARWVDTVTAFLIGTHQKPYKVDLSKKFFLEKGDVKYLWRVHVKGDDARAALILLAQCALETSIAHAPQLDSFPLVGRVEYPFDPLRGKLK